MGFARTYGALTKASYPAIPAHGWPDVAEFLGAESRWEENVRGWDPPSKRTRPLRPSFSSLGSISRGNLSRGSRLLQRWKMGHVCNLPRSESLAQPPRWERAFAAYVSSCYSLAASMVSRRYADRL